jgi:uncharacterized ubiquitin-like protein YukD
LPGSDKIPAELLIQAGGETLHYEIHELIKYLWNKEELAERRKESLILPVYKKGRLLSTSYNILSNIHM